VKGDRPFADANQDPATLAKVEHFIALMRLALAPAFNAEPNNLPVSQSLAMTAAALFAGMTVGHMIAVGALNDRDKRRAGQMVLLNFRNGVEMGKSEAYAAMAAQMPPRGTA